MHANVLKALAADSFFYREVRHDSFKSSITCPSDFAVALGYKLGRITKLVFLRSKPKEKFLIAVCSIDKKLDLIQLALLAGVKKLEMADRQQLEEIVDYPPTGVCAIGVPEHIEVYVDAALNDFTTIVTGSGEVGAELELTTADLVKVSKANLLNITL